MGTRATRKTDDEQIFTTVNGGVGEDVLRRPNGACLSRHGGGEEQTGAEGAGRYPLHLSACQVVLRSCCMYVRAADLAVELEPYTCTVLYFQSFLR